MSHLSRIVLAISASLFSFLGIAFWAAPQEAARRFGLSASDTSGVVNLRADLGGLFLGLGVLCAVGAWTRKRGVLWSASVVLAAVLVGRALGWIAHGSAAFGAAEFAIESIALLASWSTLRGLGAAPRASVATSHKALKITAATLLVLTLTSGAALLVPSVQHALFDEAAQQMSARTNSAPLEDDALRIAIAGSSAPLPSATRAKASVVVFAAGKFWVVDSGPESVENLVLWGIPLAQIGGVLLTHFHSDHIGDLGELQLQTWAAGRPRPLVVYGGPGVERVVEGFNRAYELDQGYRTAHHGETVMPSASWGMVAKTVMLDGAQSHAKDRTALVLDEGGLRITAIEVDHAPIEPAYGYRFDYEGRSVVITGDLKYHRPLERSAAGVDVLVSEAISRSMTHSLEAAAHSAGRGHTEAIMHDVQDYHISPEEAAQLANDAKVRHLAFYHLLPAPDGWLMKQIFARSVNEVRDGNWTIADDGMLYTLPLNSDEIVIGRIDR